MHDDRTDSAVRPPPGAGAAPFPVEAPPQPDPVPAGKTHLGGIYVGPPVIRNALLHSFLDGIAANGMVALNDTFAVAGAVALRASSMGIALMSSAPMLLGSIGQFLSPALIDQARGRKRFVLAGIYRKSRYPAANFRPDS